MTGLNKWLKRMTGMLLLATYAIGPTVHAQTNLLSNPVLAPGYGLGSVPNQWTHQGWTVDSTGTHEMRQCPFAYLCASYSYGIDADQQPYLDVSVVSTASETSYTNLFFNGPVPASASDNYRISIIARIVSSTAPASIGLGFHLYDATGYLSEAAKDYRERLGNKDLSLAYSFQAGMPYANTGRTPIVIQPRLSIYLAPGARIQVRIKSPLLTRGLNLSSVGVDARTGQPRLITAAPGKVLKFTAGLQGRPALPAQAVVTLVPLASGIQPPQVLPKAPTPITHLVSSGDPNVGDAWQLTLPTDVPAGFKYSIRYALRDAASGAGLALQPDADVKLMVVPGGGTASYEIGQLVVQSQDGLAIGQHFHGHPGRVGGDSRGTGPILVPYHFVRSHDSDNVGGTSWWVEDTVSHNPDGLYNWTEFDRWANFHAARGQKKLLVTFFGTPSWASSSTAQNDYGIPGLTAPPKNLDSYRKMVNATVTRYADRLYATECWNEPSANTSGFFNGTGTQLADICKAIYTATKAVNPAIPVICPASDLSWVLALTTSQGEPLHQFCDWVNGHPYNSTGADLAGADYSVDRLGDFVDSMEIELRKLGLNKPIALTEWGMFCDDRPAPAHPTHFHDMDSASRADLLYQMLAKAKEKGVVALGLYSYDSGVSAYLSDKGRSCQLGYQGIGNYNPANRQYSYDAVAAQGVTNAVRHFGKALP